jgi:endonuclease YncB( thermonuclease family)
MRARLAGKTVHAQLVRKDQYARVVAHVWLPPRLLPARWFRGAPLALEMLRAGHGTVYAQAGAEYGAWGKDKFLAVEAQARCAPRPRPSICVWVLTESRKARRGIWAAGAALETPAAYKKRMLAMDPVAVPLAVEQGGKTKGARAKK